ncbi:MAG: glycosyltransferase family 4 protein [Candidatus Diapherotrites archaeon]
MKALIVAPYFHPYIAGGMKYALDQSLCLKKAGFKVIATAAGHKSNKFKKEIIEGIKIYRLPAQFKLSGTPLSLEWRKKLNEIIEKEKPDVINGHIPAPFIADLAARIAVEKRIPFILTYHNDITKEDFFGNLLSEGYYSMLGNKTLKISSKIIATSEYYAKKSVHLRKYVHKTEFIPPAVDEKKFNLRVNRNWLKRNYKLKNKKIVLFVGCLGKGYEYKGLNYLIEAISMTKKEIPEIKLIAVGGGEEKQKYVALCRKLGIEKEVMFAGFVPSEKLPLYYAGSDAFVLPSINDSEGFGIVLIEAMACRTPVIGTKAGGIPAVIKDEKDGLIVEPRNPAELKNAIIRILKNKKFAGKIALNGHKKVFSEFSQKKFCSKITKIFFGAVKK